mgnify:CR=1 FL=1
MTTHFINQTGKQYAMRMNGENTIGVLALIAPVSTVGRDLPPQPHNGFNTSDTPFGNGHVFALNLGGTDDRHNLVPQWENWQQSGQWRRVETDCISFPGHIFRCDITYDTSLPDNYDTTKAQFADNPLVAWADPRLPTSFRVRVYNLTGAAGSITAINNDTTYDALLATLNTTVAAYDSTVLDHRAMPAEDVRIWQDRLLNGMARESYNTYVASETTRVEGTGQVLESTISMPDFLLHSDTRSEIQSAMTAHGGFSITDVTGLQMERVFQATMAIKPTALERHKAMFKKTFEPGGGKVARDKVTKARQKSAREERMAAGRKK